MYKEKVDILAIGVHPDDVELGCGGTILKHIDLGYSVGILDLTMGELGTRGSAELRMIESEKARQFCGAKFRHNLQLADGFFENDRSSKLRIIEVIRACQPDIILANAKRDRHPDHGNASKLIYEASFLSGLEKIETTLSEEKQKKWRPRKLLNYIQDYHTDPHLVIDISAYMDKKIALVKCFDSQFYDPNSLEDETPISTQSFFDFLKGRALSHGRRIDAEYGEGFTCDTYIGVDELKHVL
jgi:bacillithiol biosynthesis deacetylase BshB1